MAWLGGADRAFEHHAGANKNTFIFRTFAHGQIFQNVDFVSLDVYCQFCHFFTTLCRSECGEKAPYLSVMFQILFV
jgi:Xaa-Pro aminopeptidase